MTVDELTTLADQLGRFANEYCESGGLENYQVHFGQSKFIVESVKAEKVRRRTRMQRELDLAVTDVTNK